MSRGRRDDAERAGALNPPADTSAAKPSAPAAPAEADAPSSGPPIRGPVWVHPLEALRERDPDRLRVWAATGGWELRHCVAANEMTPEDVLHALRVRATSEGDENMLAALASNISLGVDEFEELARSSVSLVRYRLACNPNCLSRVLDYLANDPSADVRQAVLAHLMTSEEVLGRLAREAPRSVEWASVSAGNPAMPVEILRSFASSGSPLVRKAIAGNPSAWSDAACVSAILETEGRRCARARRGGRNAAPVAPVKRMVGEIDELGFWPMLLGDIGPTGREILALRWRGECEDASERRSLLAVIGPPVNAAP